MQDDKDTEMQTPAGDRIWVVATFARKVVARKEALADGCTNGEAKNVAIVRSQMAGSTRPPQGTHYQQ